MNMDIFSDPRLTLQAVTVRGMVQDHPLIWNSFPGSVVHGVLGFQLKELVCVREDGVCDKCFLVQKCPYSLFLETRPPDDAERLRKYPRVPSPLRVMVHPWDVPQLQPGDNLDVTLVFVGRAAEYATPALLALTKACADGLGRKNRDGLRGTVEVQELIDPVSRERVKWDPVWHERGLPFEPVSWSELSRWNDSWTQLRFTSPARIQAQGRIQAQPAFRDLMSSLLRRASNMAYFHCGMELDADYKGLLALTPVVPPPVHVQQARIERFSGRQKSRFRQDGVLLGFDVTAEPVELRPWLALGRILGVGKGTTMGFGNYGID